MKSFSSSLFSVLSLYLFSGGHDALGWQPTVPSMKQAMQTKPSFFIRGGEVLVRPSSHFLEPALQSPLFATAASGEVEKEWTKKRLHNSAAFRSAAILGVLALAGVSSPASGCLSAQGAGTLHLLSFATWFGSVVYTTFIAGITMFKNLPRQTFGNLQGKLFPKYFTLCSVSIMLQLISLKSLPSLPIVAKSTRALLIALAVTLTNQFYLEPITSTNMKERYSLENSGGEVSEKYKQLKSQFGKLHGISSLFNLIALCAGVTHGVYLASVLGV